jgi:hypothetical protein
MPTIVPIVALALTPEKTPKPHMTPQAAKTKARHNDENNAIVRMRNHPFRAQHARSA